MIMGAKRPRAQAKGPAQTSATAMGASSARMAQRGLDIERYPWVVPLETKEIRTRRGRGRGVPAFRIGRKRDEKEVGSWI